MRGSLRINEPQQPPASLPHTAIQAIAKYMHPARSKHSLATMTQFHFLPASFLVSSPERCPRSRPVWNSRSQVIEPELVDNNKLLVTHIWMLRERHVVIPMIAQQISGRAVVHRKSALSRIAPNVAFVPRLPTVPSVKRVAGQHIACNARRRMRV